MAKAKSSVSGITEDILTELKVHRQEIDALPCGSLVVRFAQGRPVTVRLDVDIRNVKAIDKPVMK